MDLGGRCGYWNQLVGFWFDLGWLDLTYMVEIEIILGREDMVVDC